MKWELYYWRRFFGVGMSVKHATNSLAIIVSLVSRHSSPFSMTSILVIFKPSLFNFSLQVYVCIDNWYMPCCHCKFQDKCLVEMFLKTAVFPENNSCMNSVGVWQLQRRLCECFFCIAVSTGSTRSRARWCSCSVCVRSTMERSSDWTRRRSTCWGSLSRTLPGGK